MTLDGPVMDGSRWADSLAPASHHDVRLREETVHTVIVTFSLAVLSFVVSRVITEVASRRIERQAESISKNAIIATQALTATRTNIGRAAFAMDAFRRTARPDVVGAQAASTIEASRREAAASWATYVSIPFYPGERDLVERVKPAVVER